MYNGDKKCTMEINYSCHILREKMKNKLMNFENSNALFCVFVIIYCNFYAYSLQTFWYGKD